MTTPLKTVQKQIQKGMKKSKEGGITGQKIDARAKKIGVMPGVDSPYQWIPVGDTEGTRKESF